MSKSYEGKAIIGCGGIKCACCTKGKPSVTKKLTARFNRQKAKKVLRKLVGEIE